MVGLASLGTGAPSWPKAKALREGRSRRRFELALVHAHALERLAIGHLFADLDLPDRAALANDHGALDDIDHLEVKRGWQRLRRISGPGFGRGLGAAARKHELALLGRLGRRLVGRAFWQGRVR